MLKFYNTLSKKTERFKPLDKARVTMYVCGPTVYSLDHLGHGRVGVFYDVVRRFFKFTGKKVLLVQNITDVGHLTEEEEPEDKIVREARRQGKQPLEIARYFEGKHFEVMDKLNVLRPTFSPRASDFVPKMVEFVQELIAKGYAYETKTGVYFAVKKINDYGVLSGRLEPEEQLQGVRVSSKEDKQDQRDFALWVKAEPGHLLQWDSPWGRGYPGWHIECSTMIYELLGFPIDIHGGGVDLVFPHHENERAQGLAFSGSEPVKYYLHLGQVMIGGKKMSKSLKNVVLLQELLEKYPADWVRLSLLLTHYRKPLDFQNSRLKEAAKFISRLRETKEKAPSKSSQDKGVLLEIRQAIEDDFNLPLALHIWDKKKEKISKSLFKTLANIFGLKLNPEKVPQEVWRLAKERENLRAKKEFDQADKIRKKIESLGFVVEDSASGFRIKRRDEV